MGELKKIIVMRHAKSSWEDADLSDFDRPLNKRGKKDAPKMGKYLKESGLIPERIFCSPALRAKNTALHVIQGLGISEDSLQWTESLYFQGTEAYLDAIRNAGSGLNVVMTVGHNPMTEDFISKLSGRELWKKVPTAAVACFESDAASWKDFTYGSCRLKQFAVPKELR